MGSKMAVAFANVFYGSGKTEILNLTALKPLIWKSYIDHVVSVWKVHKYQMMQFIEHANKHHHTTKFTAEIFIIYNLYRPSDTTRWCDFAKSTSNRIRSHNSQKITQFTKERTIFIK